MASEIIAYKCIIRIILERRVRRQIELGSQSELMKKPRERPARKRFRLRLLATYIIEANAIRAALSSVFAWTVAALIKNPSQLQQLPQDAIYKEIINGNSMNSF